MQSATVMLGAALSLSFAFLGMFGYYVQATGFAFTSPLGLLTSFIATFLLFIGAPLFVAHERRDKLTLGALCLTVAMATVGILVISHSAGGSNVSLSSFVLDFYLVLQSISTSLLLVLWNRFFTIAAEDEILFLVMGTLLLSLAISVGLIVIPTALTPYVFEVILPISYLLLIHANANSSEKLETVKPPLEMGSIEPNSKILQTRILFFGARVLWGALYGIMLGLGEMLVEQGPIAPAQLRSVITLIFCLGLFIGLVELKRQGAYLGLLAALFPFAIIGILALALDEITVRLLCASAWLLWYFQSYVQLPSYVHLTKMNATVFAYREKTLALVIFPLCMSASLAFAPQLRAIIAPGDLVTFGLAGIAILIGLSIAATYRHIFLYTPRIPHALRKVKARIPSLETDFHTLAQDKGLTPREIEVLQLLVCGYSRKYVEKALFISTGTARTHMNHIYQKMNVSSQDELIDLFIEPPTKINS